METGIIQEFGTGAVANESVARLLLTKWGRLMEGVKHDQKRRLLAQMYENQSQHLQQVSQLFEQTKAADVGPFTKFVFPLLRRIFPNLVTPDLVSVQPMTAPVGAVFFFDVLYATTKGAVTAGQKFAKDFNKYYSSEYIDGEVVGTGDGAALVFSATLDWTPIKNSAGLVKGEFLKVTHVQGATLRTAFADSAGTITGTNIASGSVNYATGAISITLTAAADVATAVTVYYEYNSEANSAIPQATLKIEMQEVRAGSRKLKALTSSEAAEDLRAFHGIDADSELVDHIADEIALEIDREIIDDLMGIATGGTATFDRTVPSGLNEVEHLRALVTRISSVSNAIHKATLRSPANWAVISPEVATLIEQLQTHGDFRPNIFPSEPSLPMPQGEFGVFPMGTLLNRWAIYRDPYLSPNNKILVGLKGRSFMDAGYAWAPYIPLQITGSFLDPNDFVIKKGMRTRYGKKSLRGEYYGTVTVTNL